MERYSWEVVLRLEKSTRTREHFIGYKRVRVYLLDIKILTWREKRASENIVALQNSSAGVTMSKSVRRYC